MTIMWNVFSERLAIGLPTDVGVFEKPLLIIYENIVYNPWPILAQWQNTNQYPTSECNFHQLEIHDLKLKNKNIVLQDKGCDSSQRTTLTTCAIIISITLIDINQHYESAHHTPWTLRNYCCLKEDNYEWEKNPNCINYTFPQSEHDPTTSAGYAGNTAK